MAGLTPANAEPSPDEAGAAVLEQLAASTDGLDLDEIEGIDELGPMPWLSLTESQNARSVKAWQAIAAQLPDQAQIPRGKAQIGGPPLRFAESEGVGEVGENDTPETGDLIRRFGTDPGEKGVVTITGSLSGGVVRPPIEGDCESTEDDGSIPQANPTPAVEFEVALCIGEIGDGPFGETSGDIDFYSYGVAEEGSVLILDVSHVSGSLDPANTVIGIYDADGNLLASDEDTGDPNGPGDTFIDVVAPATGEYFAAVAGCCELSTDPNDSSSGPGVGETGTYEVFVVAFPPPCTSSEDDGSIPLANESNVNGNGFDFCVGVIGDGPHGEADTDFYSLGFVEAGSFVYADVFPFEGPVATVVGLYDAAGNLLASYEEPGSLENEEFLEFEFTESGEYYIGVAGCCELQTDPNDSSSGVPSDQTGLYEIVLDVFAPPCASSEDDGSLALANDASNGQLSPEIFVNSCSGAVGDGPQAEANGDVDFYETRLVPEGRVLLVDFIDVGDAAAAGDLTIGIYNEAGELLATGQDDPSQGGPESDYFSIITPAEGIYYVAVGGAMPSDPNDPTSGTNADIVSDYTLMFIVDSTEEFLNPGEGGGLDWSLTDRRSSNAARFEAARDAANRPLAQLSAQMDAAKAEAIANAAEMAEAPVDTDFYLVDLNKGDAISGGFDAARTVGIIDPAGVQRSGSPFNPSFIYPEASPLRHDRRNGFDHVATVDGLHAVFITDGISEYEGELRVVRSGLASERSRDQQILFIDFDGAFVGEDVFGTIDANLSPLAAFLPGWDLGPDQEDAVIDATLDAIIETVDHDLRVLDGRNGDRDASRKGSEFDVEILNSRDHGDRWGDKNVTRVVIGGSIEEVQIPTLGIAQSIDPGNTETEETALVLLDVMSGPAGSSASINSYEVAEGTSKAAFVGFTLGHIAAHEIGHVIGNWHQETFNEIQALMDAGGDFAAISGVGDDGVFGTADDTDPDFEEDIFNLFEGFTGVEDTAGRSVFAFSTGDKRVPGPPRR